MTPATTHRPHRKTMRRLPILALALAPMLLGGCAQLQGRQGYIFDAVLAEGIAPGVDNRESVERTLGRPTFLGQFSDKEWYYFARETRQLAFANPRPTAQKVLRVRFDDRGNVVAVDTTGPETVARLRPIGDRTPTLGRRRTFFEDVFGNIGAVGAPGAGAPAGQ